MTNALSTKLLLVDDDVKLCRLVRDYLEPMGYSVTVAHTGPDGLEMAVGTEFDAVILDVMLPAINGLDVCKSVRKEGINTPILMLTALGTLDDKVSGLQAGADDYLVKPFHFKELIARIQALTRRQQINTPAVSNTLQVADLQLDRNRKTVCRDDKEIVLTAKEYALLEMFMQNTHRILSRDDIGEQVWGSDFDSSSNVIDVYINYLRNKIEKGFSSKLIHTVIGRGYTMKEQ